MTVSAGSAEGDTGVDWHARATEDVRAELGVDTDGLTDSEAERRLARTGPNEIREPAEVDLFALFVSQFQDALIYLLLGAAVLSLAVGLIPGQQANYVDAGLIAVILLGNGLFGFIQDYRAEKAMETLRELAAPEAMVIRDGHQRVVDATMLVPGDVIVIEQGDAIPADARLLEATNLETVEASLTGESAPISKTSTRLDHETPLAERENMVYTGTNAVAGRGRAVVVATGMETEVGGIATQIRDAEETPTPFRAEVDRLGRRIGYGVIGLVVLLAVALLGFTQTDPVTVLLLSVTLAVAAVPEGLPAVVTVTLALGSQTLAKQNAIVRRLPVVESLGSVDVILTDKTGTLTENQMTVRRLAVGDDVYEVTGTGLDPNGTFRRGEDTVDPEPLTPLLRCGLYCNDATAAPPSADEEYYGDPTEIALRVAAAKAGIDDDVERRREIPFSSDRKRMTVLVESDGEYVAYSKGAPDTILERCDRVLVDGTVEPLTDDRRHRIRETTAAFASDALRVLGFARKSVPDPTVDDAELEDGLVFLGTQGMIDPPRDEVDRAVADCRSAGIRVVMVTGDNVETAKAIGSAIGFDPDGAMDGRAVDALDDAELQAAVESVEVFARVAPRHKVAVLKALQANGHTVAMTGDGVNDASSVRTADVGISMGIRGTDVTKEASDVVLRDDNFATIRDAIAEGRGIFDNIRKFVNYLLSANAGEVLVVFVGVVIASTVAPFLGIGRSEALVLTPVMLLWINLVTDGLPALALGTDPKADSIMDRPPRRTDEPVITRRTMASIGTIAVLMAVTGLSLFFFARQATQSLVRAQTLLFTFLVVVEVIRIQLVRSRYHLGPFSNRWLVGAVASSIGLQLAVLYTPVSQFFRIVPIEAAGWTWIGVAFVGFVLAGVITERVITRVMPGH